MRTPLSDIAYGLVMFGIILFLAGYAFGAPNRDADARAALAIALAKANVEKSTSQPCACDCPCGKAGCDCGCCEGLECICLPATKTTGTKRALKVCPCSPECTCGCAEGQPCRCGNTAPPAPTEGSLSLSYYTAPQPTLTSGGFRGGFFTSRGSFGGGFSSARGGSC